MDEQSLSGDVPRHVAIIMDGNGRWAQRRGQPRHSGHRAGQESVRTMVEQCIQHGVEVLTLFAFSSENWRRPKKEVGFLMDLFMAALQREVRRLQANGVRLRVIGDISAFSPRLQQKIRESEALTASNDQLLLQIAANYGGRWDITQAARRLAAKVRAGEMEVADVDESALSAELSFADQVEPDLFIRTGGERRISNFLLWQCAYSELYFTETLWPDFGAEAFRAALLDFQARERRFGKTSAQLAKHASG